MSVTLLSQPNSAPATASPATAPLVQSATLLRRFCGAVARVVSTMIFEARVRRAARELQKLDDHTLWDIGISRSEIDSIVRHGPTGDITRRWS